MEHARHKRRLKRGGGMQRLELVDAQVADGEQTELVLAVDDSLAALAEQNAQAAELVKLRYFGGLTLPEAAAAIDVSTVCGETPGGMRATIDSHWMPRCPIHG